MGAPRICVQVAFLEELRPLARSLNAGPVSPVQGLWMCHATVSGASICLAASGMGADRAAAAAHMLSQQPLNAAVITGFGAANRADLGAGEVVVATRVCKDGTNLSLVPDRNLNAIARSTPGRVEYGTFHTLEGLLTTEHQKRAAAARLEAAIVEMETFAAAEVYERSGVPWLALRAVSDSVCSPLPLNFAEYLDTSTGQLDRLRLARGLLSHPGAWAEFARLAVRSRAAARNLARWVELYVLRLIPVLDGP